MFFFFFILIFKCLATIYLTIGIDMPDRDSLYYLGTLEKYYSQFQEIGLKLNILYHILPCYSCKITHNFTKPIPHCYGGGIYCQFSLYPNGQLLLTESIRQKYLFLKDISLFLNYIKVFKIDSLENPDSDSCSSHILRNKLPNSDIIQFNNCQVLRR